MSHKPVKKSDQSKSWMKPRRDKKILAKPEYHLIVSEGTKTEPNYFKGLVAEINQGHGKGRIHIKIEDPDDCVSYHALWSNQCVELWFLLHFSYFQSDIHRDEYKPILDKHLSNFEHGKYKKNRTDIYHILRPHLGTAIRNAKLLAKSHTNKVPSKNTPGTKVFEIFEALSVYLKSDS